MKDFKIWREMDYKNSIVQLWVFKKSTTAAKFRAWHVRTDSDIENLFRETVESEVSRITEKIKYNHLSENNENSCLEHSLEECEGLIALLQAVDAPESENTDAKLKELKGAAGYIVKFQFKKQTIYAVRKTSQMWKPTVRNKFINAIFLNGELSATPIESFVFDLYFDFYSVNETVFISSKRAYESTMSDKKAYKKSFNDLIVDSDFSSIFANIEPLKQYVGQNSMQLRRMTVIQQKALYRTPGFLEKVKNVNKNRGWGINFDQDGKISLCENTTRIVIQVLLDHRLLSEVTETTYDVPDAAAI